MFLSIITPTYNRKNTLSRCYESLLQQTEQDFEWIVVDDGSTDSTDRLVDAFIHENRIRIKYLYQKNGGKHRAHNTGVRNAEGMMCVCLDSDDALSPDAVEYAKKIWMNREYENAIGILAKRGDFKEHKPICASWPEDIKISTMLELQEVYGFSGDTVLFFDTDLLKKHYFVEFENENFIPEDSLYVELDSFGPMILVNQVFYYCEYLQDGLTAHYKKLLRDNPIGTSYCYYKRMTRSTTMKKKFHNAIIAQSYLALSNNKKVYLQKDNKIILFIAKLAVPLYMKLKIER